jgi:nucleoside-diphosphate-sugar epimerase
MQALVTGSSGFVGRHFAWELISRGWTVVGWDIVPPNLDDFNQAAARSGELEGRFLWGCGDLVDALRVDDFQYSNFDLVVHAAAMSPNRVGIDYNPESHIHNRMLDSALFAWAIRTSQKRVIYLSSCAVLDETPDDYGMVKLAGERMAVLARRAGVEVTVVRPYSGYGSDQDMAFPFGAFLERAAHRDDPFEIWNQNAIRDFIHIDDVVNGALAVAENGTDEPVSLCTGIGTSMADLATSICFKFGYVPLLNARGDAPAGVNYRVGDPTKLHEVYRPTVSLQEGITRAVQDWMEKSSK